jgi:zinc-ribbon domain
VRCPRCGNENSEENRFCGMCGAKLSPAPVEVASVPAQGTAMRSSTTAAAPSPTPVRPQAAPAPRPAPPQSEEPTFITGPSFLGLNDPAPRKRANLNSDSHGSSSNLDYLLDDEEPRRGGAGKFFLILLALALAVGFGYLRWKNQGLPWLHTTPNKPAAAAENSDTTDTNSTAPPTANSPTAAPTPVAQPTPQPAAQDPAQPTPDAPAASTPPAGTQAATPDAGNAPANTPPATAAAPAASDAPNSAPNSSATSEPAAKDPSEEPSAAAPDTPPAPAPKPKKPASSPAPKPHAGVAPTPVADPVGEAQRYIYGRGASQDCERGMRLLKPAAAQANPKAMIEMGALYSAGLCTPHDLPTAYRWFAMALRKQPDNQAVQADLQKLWGEMTQPERQLAIKLSQ